jgi:hypothetical protein
MLGQPLRKADLYDLEQLIQIEVVDELVGVLRTQTNCIPAPRRDRERGQHR